MSEEWFSLFWLYCGIIATQDKETRIEFIKSLTLESVNLAKFDSSIYKQLIE